MFAKGLDLSTTKCDKNCATAATLACALVFIIVIGNLLVLFVVYYSTMKRQTTTHMQNANVQLLLIGSLAVADLLVGICVMPLAIHQLIHNDRWPFGTVVCIMYQLCDALLFHFCDWPENYLKLLLRRSQIMCTISVHSLVVIALERLLAITCPLRYPQWVTIRRAQGVIVLVWFLSIVLLIPLGKAIINENSDVDACEKSDIYSASSNCTSFFYAKSVGPSSSTSVSIQGNPKVAIISSAVSFFIPIIIILCVYARIYYVARQALTCIARQYSDSQPVSGCASPAKQATSSNAKKSASSLPNSPPNSSTEKAKRPLNALSGAVDRLHREAYAARRQDPLMASIRRIRYSKNRTQSNIAQKQAVSSTGYSRRMSHDSAQRHQLNPVVEEGTDSRALSQPAQARRQMPKITPEMIERFNALNSYNLGGKRSDPLKQSIRRLRAGNAPLARLLTTSNDSQDTIALKSKEQSRRSAHRDSASSIASQVTDRLGNIIERTKRRLSAATQQRLDGAFWRVFMRLASLRQNMPSKVHYYTVTGAFIACWLPFSVLFVLRAMAQCSAVDVPVQCSQTLFTVFVWLGYINSALNPFIYSLFNREFRESLCTLLDSARRQLAAAERSTHSASMPRHTEHTVAVSLVNKTVV